MPWVLLPLSTTFFTVSTAIALSLFAQCFLVHASFTQFLAIYSYLLMLTMLTVPAAVTLARFPELFLFLASYSEFFTVLGFRRKRKEHN